MKIKVLNKSQRKVGKWWLEEKKAKPYGRLAQLNKHGKVPHSQRKLEEEV